MSPTDDAQTSAPRTPNQPTLLPSTLRTHPLDSRSSRNSPRKRKIANDAKISVLTVENPATGRSIVEINHKTDEISEEVLLATTPVLELPRSTTTNLPKHLSLNHLLRYPVFMPSLNTTLTSPILTLISTIRISS